jgi:hypothetical protein
VKRENKAELSFQLKALSQRFRVPCETEFRFHPVRRWRFDGAFPSVKIAVEIDGGVWSYGRHNRGSGYLKDMEKLNHAARLGWAVYHFTPQMLTSGEFWSWMEEVMRK